MVETGQSRFPSAFRALSRSTWPAVLEAGPLCASELGRENNTMGFCGLAEVWYRANSSRDWRSCEFGSTVTSWTIVRRIKLDDSRWTVLSAMFLELRAAHALIINPPVGGRWQGSQRRRGESLTLRHSFQVAIAPRIRHDRVAEDVRLENGIQEDRVTIRRTKLDEKRKGNNPVEGKRSNTVKYCILMPWSVRA